LSSDAWGLVLLADPWPGRDRAAEADFAGRHQSALQGAAGHGGEACLCGVDDMQHALDSPHSGPLCIVRLKVGGHACHACHACCPQAHVRPACACRRMQACQWESRQATCLHMRCQCRWPRLAAGPDLQPALVCIRRASAGARHPVPRCWHCCGSPSAALFFVGWAPPYIA
jgi:hypothetical protein